MTLASTLVPAPAVTRHKRLITGAATGLGLHLAALVCALVYVGRGPAESLSADEAAGRFFTLLAVEATISPTIFMVGIVFSIVPPTRRFGLGLLAGAALGLLGGVAAAATLA